MSIYKLENGSLSYVDETPFNLEKEIQTLCENNLKHLLDLELVASEFSVSNFRIDSLAYDKTQKSFVIIEYKKDKNFSVIDQGYAYLAVMLNNKAEFILKYNESGNTALRKTDIDWSQSKVIFIAPTFTNVQKAAINFKDLPIELWQIKCYMDNLINFAQITPASKNESINIIQKTDKRFSKVSSEIKVYSEDTHLENKPPYIVELYQGLKQYILNFGDNITVKPTKIYIGFITKTNFCDIKIDNKKLKIWLNMPFNKLNDPLLLTRNVANIGHNGNGECEILIYNDKNLEYLVGLIKQSYNYIK